VRTTVRYTNTGSTAVTLDLAADLRDPAGTPAPAGMATVRPARLTVPAGGEAAATVTTDTRVSGPDGQYGGAGTATAGGGPTVRTPLGLVKEVESYDVTVTFVDPQGKPPQEAFALFVDVNSPDQPEFAADMSSPTLRLPRGTYLLYGWTCSPTGDQ